jgi:hypothetical protein
MQGILTNTPPPMVPSASTTITISPPTDVHDEKLPPRKFILHQNHPNPFNPATVIRYQLPVTSHVTLRIFDVLGQEVTELINSEQQPGYHQIEWQPSNSASGVYFYRIEATATDDSGKRFAETKKMLLLR